MSKSLFSKLLFIGVLMCLLLVPLQMLTGLVSERQSQRQSVLSDIAQSASGPQQVAGPVVVVPYRVRRVEKEMVVIQQNGQANSIERDKEVFTDHLRTILPTTLAVDVTATTSTLYRGLYEALLFTAQMRLTGTFEIDVSDLSRDPSTTVGAPYLAVGISDVRGIRNTPQLDWQGNPVALQPDSQLDLLGNGIHAPLHAIDTAHAGTYHFTLPLQLLGTESLAMVPIGKDTRVNVVANWPHPSFYGHSLPAQRHVRADGFTADWQTSWFNTNLNRVVEQMVAKGEHGLDAYAFGVRFIQPVDQYQQAERALKYAILFVLLTFAGFFLFEVLRRLPIHAMQYALVGAALAMFYLLLIALSEHVDFALAYGIASAASAALIGFYLAHVLRRWQRGAAFGALLGLLYATLYGLLQSEDNALLLGALLMFAALAAVMVLTRRLDWYAVGVAAGPAVEREVG